MFAALLYFITSSYYYLINKSKNSKFAFLWTELFYNREHDKLEDEYVNVTIPPPKKELKLHPIEQKYLKLRTMQCTRDYSEIYAKVEDLFQKHKSQVIDDLQEKWGEILQDDFDIAHVRQVIDNNNCLSADDNQLKKRMFKKNKESIMIEYKHNIEKFNKDAVRDDFIRQKRIQDYPNIINNYVLEYLHVYGNVAMRYNPDIDSFEYFCNKYLPYMLAEKIAMKYVVTFHCTELFVYMKDELKLCDGVKPKFTPIDLSKIKRDCATPFIENSNNSSSNKSGAAPHAAIKKEKRQFVLKQRANQYTYKGGFLEYNPLKSLVFDEMRGFVPIKIPESTVATKTKKLKFSDFKKMSADVTLTSATP